MVDDVVDYIDKYGPIRLADGRVVGKTLNLIELFNKTPSCVGCLLYRAKFKAGKNCIDAFNSIVDWRVVEDGGWRGIIGCANRAEKPEILIFLEESQAMTPVDVS